MRSNRSVFAIALAIALSSCGSVPTSEYIEPPPPPTPPPPPPAPPIVVEIVSSLALGTLQCNTFRAYAQKGVTKDSASFNTSCRAEISSKVFLSDTGRTIVWFDAIDRTNRTYHPALASVSSDSLKYVQKFIAGPLQYTIHNGLWGGQTVGIDLATAFTISSDGKMSFYARSQQRDGSFVYSVGGRSPSKFPLQIAIRKVTEQQFLPTDTVGFGSAVAELSNELGIPFTLVPLASAQLSGWDGILVTLSDNIIISNGDPVWAFNGDIVGGAVNLASRSDPVHFRFTVKHEITHTLGVGHPKEDSKWLPSLMSRDQSVITVDDSRYGVPQTLETGHLWFMYDVWEAQKQSGAQYGIANMHQGWRVLVQDLPLEVIR